jgi:hypothetical protein
MLLEPLSSIDVFCGGWRFCCSTTTRRQSTFVLDQFLFFMCWLATFAKDRTGCPESAICELFGSAHWGNHFGFNLL